MSITGYSGIQLNMDYVNALVCVSVSLCVCVCVSVFVYLCVCMCGKLWNYGKLRVRGSGMSEHTCQFVLVVLPLTHSLPARIQ